PSGAHGNRADDGGRQGSGEARTRSAGCCRERLRTDPAEIQSVSRSGIGPVQTPPSRAHLLDGSRQRQTMVACQPEEHLRDRTQEPVPLHAAAPQKAAEQLRNLGTLDVGPKSAVGEIEVVLLKGETIMPDAARLFRSRPPNPDHPVKTVTAWRSPLATEKGQP